MPIDFDKTRELESTTNLRGRFAGWGTRLRSIINDSLGSSNPFGTAATRDIGTGANQIPVLGAGGIIDANRIQTANTTQGGRVVLSEERTSDATMNGIPLVMLASIMRGFFQNIEAGVSVESIRVRQSIPVRPASFNRPAIHLIPTAAGLLVFSGSGVYNNARLPLLPFNPESRFVSFRYEPYNTYNRIGETHVTASGGWVRGVNGSHDRAPPPPLYGAQLLTDTELESLSSRDGDAKEFIGGIRLQGFGNPATVQGDSRANGDLVIAIKRSSSTALSLSGGPFLQDYRGFYQGSAFFLSF